MKITNTKFFGKIIMKNIMRRVACACFPLGPSSLPHFYESNRLGVRSYDKQKKLKKKKHPRRGEKLHPLQFQPITTNRNDLKSASGVLFKNGKQPLRCLNNTIAIFVNSQFIEK